MKSEKKKEAKRHKSADKADTETLVGPSIASSSVTKGPMTKEEWETQQSVTRRVFDPDTGRTR